MRRVNRQMNIIAAVDANWAIGYKNELLVKIPNDQKWFQKITTGKVVVMGRKTMETFPNGMPLKNRTNIVLTGDRALRVKDAELVYGIEELLEKLKQYNTEDVYVIGGESVYEELLPYCDTAYITVTGKVLPQVTMRVQLILIIRWHYTLWSRLQ